MSLRGGVPGDGPGGRVAPSSRLLLAGGIFHFPRLEGLPPGLGASRRGF